MFDPKTKENLFTIFFEPNYSLYKHRKKLKPIEYITSLTLTQTWLMRYLPYSDPGWYLSALVFLYLCFPSLYKFAKNNTYLFYFANIWLVLFTAFFVNKFMNIYINYGYSIKEIYYLTHFFPPIMMGVFCSGISSHFITKRMRQNWIYSILLIIVFVVSILSLSKRTYITSISFLLL